MRFLRLWVSDVCDWNSQQASGILSLIFNIKVVNQCPLNTQPVAKPTPNCDSEQFFKLAGLHGPNNCDLLIMTT